MLLWALHAQRVKLDHENNRNDIMIRPVSLKNKLRRRYASLEFSRFWCHIYILSILFMFQISFSVAGQVEILLVTSGNPGKYDTKKKRLILRILIIFIWTIYLSSDSMYLYSSGKILRGTLEPNRERQCGWENGGAGSILGIIRVYTSRSLNIFKKQKYQL